MAKNKTTETQNSVTAFIEAVPDQTKQQDSWQLIAILQKLTGSEPKMWGPSIIGFGSYHYKYASGHEGDAPLAGFSPRKDAISLYLWPTFDAKETLLQNFGKFKAGKSCIYIKKLADIDLKILEELVALSIKEVKILYP